MEAPLFKQPFNKLSAPWRKSLTSCNHHGFVLFLVWPRHLHLCGLFMRKTVRQHLVNSCTCHGSVSEKQLGLKPNRTQLPNRETHTGYRRDHWSAFLGQQLLVSWSQIKAWGHDETFMTVLVTITTPRATDWFLKE